MALDAAGPPGLHQDADPNLTFEVLADSADFHDAGQALAALAQVDGRPVLAVDGTFPAFAGHFAGQSGSVADALGPLLALAGASVVPGTVPIVRGAGCSVTALKAEDCHARLPSAERRRDRRRLTGGERRIGAVEVSFYDTSREYQPGVQRVRREAAAVVDQQAFACAMTPDEAKGLAARLLARSEARRWQLGVRLPWRHVSVRPGDTVTFEDQPGLWRVRQARFESFIVNLELEREAGAVAVPSASDGGRIAAFDAQPVGQTMLAVLDLPALPGDPVATPRLWVAGAGNAAGWRRAPLEVSTDGGESYVLAGTLAGPTPMGTCLTPLQPGPADHWDRINSVEVALLSDSLWLEGRSEASVVAGANLALVGAEIIQFSTAEQLGPGRFRLSGLLRGRLGTEAAIASHAAGEQFVLLDQASMLAFDASTDAVGRSLLFRPAGSGDAGVEASQILPVGRALRPLAPAHLVLTETRGEVTANWIRRSRLGFGWTDFVDAPLSEANESYRVEVALDGRLVRTVVTDAPHFTYSFADRLADGDGAELTIAVAQMSALVGPGETATATITL